MREYGWRMSGRVGTNCRGRDKTITALSPTRLLTPLQCRSDHNPPVDEVGVMAGGLLRKVMQAPIGDRRANPLLRRATVVENAD
jgi:hypothetical protein